MTLKALDMKLEEICQESESSPREEDRTLRGRRMSVLTSVPQFPSPPPREVGFPSRKSSPRARPVSFSFGSRKRHASQHEKNRPASSYGSRKQNKNIVYPRLPRERGKSIRQRVTALRFKMTDPKSNIEPENGQSEHYVPHITGKRKTKK